MVVVESLIDGGEAYRWISSAIARIDRPIDFCSAFLRSEALIGLLQSAPKSLTGRILVRWQLGDFIAGASDFAAFDVALSHGLRMYMSLNFHGKVYSLPPQGIVVGSANATLAGLGMSKDSNSEVCTLMGYCEPSQKFIDRLFASAIEVDHELVRTLKAIVDGTSIGEVSREEWPQAITNRFAKGRRVCVLLVDECFWSSPEWVTSQSIDVFNKNVSHDLSLLGLSVSTCWTDQAQAHLATLLTQPIALQWLRTVLHDNKGTVYFGQLTTLMHSSISDVPSPSREGIKVLLQNLLEWVMILKIDDIVVDRPNHSQRVRLANWVSVC